MPPQRTRASLQLLLLRRALEAADFFVPADTLWSMDAPTFLRAASRIIRDAESFGPYESLWKSSIPRPMPRSRTALTMSGCPTLA